jgi:hypothetical protein
MSDLDMNSRPIQAFLEGSRNCHYYANMMQLTQDIHWDQSRTDAVMSDLMAKDPQPFILLYCVGMAASPDYKFFINLAETSTAGINYIFFAAVMHELRNVIEAADVDKVVFNSVKAVLETVDVDEASEKELSASIKDTYIGTNQSDYGAKFELVTVTTHCLRIIKAGIENDRRPNVDRVLSYLSEYAGYAGAICAIFASVEPKKHLLDSTNLANICT